MRVQTEEWRRFIPGVRMYKGKMTFFYNGEVLYDDENQEDLIYDWDEKQRWEVVIILPGVEIIPLVTFSQLKKLETVIMADTVRRIEDCAFEWCSGLMFIKLSTNLEYIGKRAFNVCESLTSIFIPPSCREIDECAFIHCCKLIIFHVSRHTELGRNAILKTALIRASPFETDRFGRYENQEEVNTWLKNRLQDDEFALHQACSSFHPLEEVLFGIVQRQGIKAFKNTDSIGVTPSQYLSHNPYTDITEEKILKRYILDMMGEIVI